MDANRSPLTCTSEELYTIVSSSNRRWLLLCLSNPAMSENHVLALLRNPTITTDVVHSIYERYEWISSYKVQFAIANCPKTPFPLCIKVLQLLFWNDLVRTCSNYRLTPQVRRAAENFLREKVSGLTLGEKKSLARTAPRVLIGFLRNEIDADVFPFLLRNPQLAEDDLLATINQDRTPSGVLETIGSDYKWSTRYPIRLALVRNVHTPLHIALSFVSKLKKQDLEALAHSPQTTELVRRAAKRILTGNY